MDYNLKIAVSLNVVVTVVTELTMIVPASSYPQFCMDIIL